MSHRNIVRLDVHKNILYNFPQVNIDDVEPLIDKAYRDAVYRLFKHESQLYLKLLRYTLEECFIALMNNEKYNASTLHIMIHEVGMMSNKRLRVELEDNFLVTNICLKDCPELTRRNFHPRCRLGYPLTSHKEISMHVGICPADK